MRIGFIGLGHIGNPMAMQVMNSGFALTVHDLRRETARNLIDGAAAWADSPRALAEQSDVVVTSLPSPAAVEAVLEGEDGVLAGLASGATWIDMTTNDLHVVLRLADRAAERDIHTLEAPITGGVARAREGRLTILVGGEKNLLETHLPVLQAMGEEILHVGPIGHATIAKLITNQLCFIHTVALGEGLMLGARAGLDLPLLSEAIKLGYGNSFVAEVDGPLILRGGWETTFSLALTGKDLRLTTELGRELDVPLELTALVEQINARARVSFGAEADWLDVVKLMEEACGTELRAAGF